jgi:hypothetical protein
MDGLIKLIPRIRVWLQVVDYLGGLPVLSQLAPGSAGKMTVMLRMRDA